MQITEICKMILWSHTAQMQEEHNTHSQQDLFVVQKQCLTTQETSSSVYKNFKHYRKVSNHDLLFQQKMQYKSAHSL